MRKPDPLAVRRLRIFLAHNEIINRKSLLEIASHDLARFMGTQSGFPDQDLSEEHGLHWNCRKLRDWMQSHNVLQSAYNEGKRLVNPSGRAYEQKV